MLNHRQTAILVFSLIIVLFLLLRLPGVDLLYHLDEYSWPKWAFSSRPGDAVPHPPLGKFIFNQFGQITGEDYFRVIPLTFSLVNLFLLFYLSRIVFGTRAALWTSFLFAVSAYSVLASLMVDTDGAIMPFFFLLSAIAYFKVRESQFALNGRLRWWLLLVLAVTSGFLVKASFIIPVAALALDFAIETGAFRETRRLLRYCLGVLFGLAGLAGLFLAAKFIFPYFSLGLSVKYWLHFFNLGDRGWLQTLIQFAKALMYLSPLLVMPLVLMDGETARKSRPFLFVIIVGLVFYLLIFDFSDGALDRYLQFLIIPLCVVAGAVLAKIFTQSKVSKRETGVLVGVLLSGLAVLALQFIPHSVPPHYPKADWLWRALSLKWNFLFPFTGGSGPAGFYVSFLFIALLWIGALALVLWARRNIGLAKGAAAGILVLSLLYNGVFIEEYLFGKINGSLPRLFAGALDFVSASDGIREVVSYNGVGGHELKKLDKWRRRFYAAPQFEAANREFFSNYSGHVLYINIPRIGEDNFYYDYLKSCLVAYREEDKYITALVLGCAAGRGPGST